MSEPNIERLVMSSTHLSSQGSIYESVRHTKALGFWGMEVFGRDIVSGALTDPRGLSELRDAAERCDLTLTAHPWFNWTKEPVAEATQCFRELLTRCHFLGIEFVNVHLNFLSDPTAGIKRAADIVRPLLGQLEDENIALCFENVPSILPNPLGSQPEEFEAFFQEVDHPRVALTIDTGHAHISGNLDAFLRRLADKWVYTHLADNAGAADEHLAPGMGSIDWRQFATLANEQRYNGPLIFEFPERYIAACQQTLGSAFEAMGKGWPQVG